MLRQLEQDPIMLNSICCHHICHQQNICNTPSRKSVQYQVSHYSILEAKVGNDKLPGFMFVNKGKIVISKKDMYSINKLEMGHSRN